MRLDSTELVLISIQLQNVIADLKSKQEFWATWDPRIAEPYAADIAALAKLETCFENARAVDIKPMRWREAVRHE